MDAARCRRGRKPLSAPPRRKRGTQEISGIRAAFSLASFFSTAWMQEVGQCRSNCRGRAKKSISPAGAGTGFKSNVAIATHCRCCKLNITENVGLHCILPNLRNDILFAALLIFEIIPLFEVIFLEIFNHYLNLRD
jgi:hypothetical protein